MSTSAPDPVRCSNPGCHLHGGGSSAVAMPAGPVYREAERQQGIVLAGSLAHLLDSVAAALHHNESLHLHEVTADVGRCGYCYLRAGRTLGVVAAVVTIPPLYKPRVRSSRAREA